VERKTRGTEEKKGQKGVDKGAPIGITKQEGSKENYSARGPSFGAEDGRED